MTPRSRSTRRCAPPPTAPPATAGARAPPPATPPPPRRAAAGVAAVKVGLADGTIDAIATDHAPHPVEAKEAPFDQAPPRTPALGAARALAPRRARRPR